MGWFTEALIFAATAHEDQMYGDVPYILHSVEVAEAALKAGATETIVQSALLHDVVEDTDVSLRDIELEFGFDIAAIVAGLTKGSEDYEAYIEEMPEQSRAVKFFDSLCNYKGLLDVGVSIQGGQDRYDRLIARYERNIAALYPSVIELGLDIEDRLLAERLIERAERVLS